VLNQWHLKHSNKNKKSQDQNDILDSTFFRQGLYNPSVLKVSVSSPALAKTSSNRQLQPRVVVTDEFIAMPSLT